MLLSRLHSTPSSSSFRGLGLGVGSGPMSMARNLAAAFVSSSSSTASAAASASAAVPPAPPAPEAKIVVANKRNISQSPFRMRFLAKLARNAWVPDALAQMKFSPKHKAEDVAKIIKRACALARINFQAIPEELIVKEIITNKGSSFKKLRIMGRGRTGVGVIAKTHVTVKVEVVDFEKKIAECNSQNQKNKWSERKVLVQKLKAQPVVA